MARHGPAGEARFGQAPFGVARLGRSWQARKHPGALASGVLSYLVHGWRLVAQNVRPYHSQGFHDGDTRPVVMAVPVPL